MNRGDLERMRARLAARSAADTQNSPAVVVLAGVLWLVVCLAWAFL